MDSIQLMAVINRPVSTARSQVLDLEVLVQSVQRDNHALENRVASLEAQLRAFQEAAL